MEPNAVEPNPLYIPRKPPVFQNPVLDCNRVLIVSNGNIMISADKPAKLPAYVPHEIFLFIEPFNDDHHNHYNIKTLQTLKLKSKVLTISEVLIDVFSTIIVFKF